MLHMHYFDSSENTVQNIPVQTFEADTVDALRKELDYLLDNKSSGITKVVLELDDTAISKSDIVYCAPIKI